MEKIITKSVEDKVTEWVKKYDAINVKVAEDGERNSEHYARTGGDSGSDFDILEVEYSQNGKFERAILYTFKDMDIDKYLSNEHKTYDFYAWIELNKDHVDAESYNHWIKGDYYDDYFFSLYVDYLLDQKQHSYVECIYMKLEPDYKEVTLAESIKNSFAEVFDKEEWAKVLTDAFHEENSGQGVWLVRSDSSFYEKGYSYTCRTPNHAYIIMVNSNIWEKVIKYVKGEGFLLFDGTTNVYGSGCVQGKRVTLY